MVGCNTREENAAELEAEYERLEKKKKFVCSDGKRFITLREAKAHASKVFDTTGIVLAIIKNRKVIRT